MQSLKRENDVFLTGKICQVIKQATILEHLNNVRLYLQVSRLSDIVTDDGTLLHDWAMYKPPTKSTLYWPKTGYY